MRFKTDMQRKEKISVTVLCLIVLIGAAGVFLTNEIGKLAYADSPTEGDVVLLKEADTVFPMGEFGVLSSSEDEESVVGDQCYDASLGWEGTLEVRVDDVALYDSSEAAGLDGGAVPFRSTTDERGYSDAAFMLATVTIKNRDAVPPLTTGGREWFNVSFLQFSPDLPPVYFDGAPENAIEHDGFCFDLPQGETATYALGFICPNETPVIKALEASLLNQSFFIDAGVSGVDEKDKYHFQVEVVDKRSSDWSQRYASPEAVAMRSDIAAAHGML